MRLLPSHLPADGVPGSLADDDKRVLAGCALFTGCSDEQRERAYAFGFVRHLPLGAFLLQPGEPNGHVYVIAAGQLAAFRDAAMQQQLARFVPGDCIGEHAVVGSGGGTTYVTAQWPARLVAFDAAQLRALMETVPRIALNLLDLLSARLRASNLRIDSVKRVESMDFMATHDALTGLHNRRWLQGIYPARLSAAAQEGEPLCLALIDIDRFDRMNRTLGRTAGDAILRQLADLVRQAMPALDTLARLTGDRYAALIPGRLAEVTAACERLRYQVSGRQFALRGALATQITVSIGVAQAAADLDDALERAAQALARAKERGRNVVEPPPG
ncbi:hypothetical protein GCM10023144_45530 [Pigmentiphaga soli]|uniref:diguanylate cyclase n=1 Tax=Pigmentiphaga soli TaxID=1007095 RepID=A0ABP8HR07_9BURK